jgi:hypothetical protein
MRLLIADARARGMSTTAYLGEAGIMGRFDAIKVRQHEVTVGLAVGE